MASGKRITRRQVLRIAGVAGGTAALAACGATPTPQVVEKVVTQIVAATPEVVKETVVVQQTVEKVVQQTVVVEKAVTPAPSDISGQVRLWVFPMTDNDQDTIWTPLNNRFKQAYPKIEVSLELLPWAGRREKMLTAYAAGQQPDIAYVNTDTLSLFGTNDVLAPLDDVIPSEVWDDLQGNLQAGLMWEGKRLMFPTLLIGTGYLYNKKLFSEIGWDPEKPPLTWDDIRKLGADSKAKGYFMTSWNTTNWGDNWITPLWQAGGNVYSKDLTKVQLTSDAAHETLQFMVDLFQNGWVPKEGAVGTEQEASAVAPTNYWITGKQTLSDVGNPNITTNTRAQAKDLEFGFVPVWKNKRQTQLGGAGCWGMFKNSKAPKAAEAWLLWMIAPEQQGFYGSVTKFAPPRKSAWQYWAAEADPKKFVEIRLQYLEMNQDSSYFWQEGKITCAPQFQAAVLGMKTVDQALSDAQTDLQKIVDDWNAKRKKS